METEKITTLWFKYNEYTNQLAKALGTKNILGEYAEYLAHKYYGGKKLPPSHPGADIEANGNKYQVKGRKPDNDKPTTQLSIIRSWNFDHLVVILFNKDGSVKQALEVPVGVAREYAAHNTHQNGRVITTTKNFLSDERSKDITVKIQEINKEM